MEDTNYWNLNPSSSPNYYSYIISLVEENKFLRQSLLAQLDLQLEEVQNYQNLDYRIMTISKQLEEFASSNTKVFDILNDCFSSIKQLKHEQDKAFSDLQSTLQEQSKLIQILLVNELSRTLGIDGESMLKDLLTHNHN